MDARFKKLDEYFKELEKTKIDQGCKEVNRCSVVI